MLLLIALPVLIIVWFLVQAGRRQAWKDKQKRLSGESRIIDHKPKDKR